MNVISSKCAQVHTCISGHVSVHMAEQTGVHSMEADRHLALDLGFSLALPFAS